MKINHDNYESILIDYFDGTLNDVERAEVDLFLQQNPEIAEQISGFSDVVLSPSDDIVFNQKEELLIVTLPNQEFEAWENTQPKLSKEQISYPHKQKLLKLGKRRTTQWTWYAMVACFVFALLVGRWVFETAEAEFPQIAVLQIEPIEIENVELKIENESKYEVHFDASRASASVNHQSAVVELVETPASRHPKPDSEQDVTITREHLAIAMITPISIPISSKKAIIERSEPIFFEQFETESFQHQQFLTAERLELALNDFVIAPAKNVIHNIARRFFERRTEVELLLEEQEFPQFFARR
ncbi:MAG: hypothetical protein FWC94_07580 [Bacteroidales bacterium]|nr:hypothetical protein [Bacteroidales bacterium]